MHVTSAKLLEIELKSGKTSPRFGTNVHLEIGDGGTRLGNQVIVRIWVPVDTETTSLSEIHEKAAQAVHQVLQGAASASQADLRACLDKSLQYDPDR